MHKLSVLAIALFGAIALHPESKSQPAGTRGLALDLQLVSKSGRFDDTRIDLRVVNTTFKPVMVLGNPRLWQCMAAFFKDANNQDVELRAPGPVARMRSVLARDFVRLAPKQSLVWSYSWADKFRNVESIQRYRLSFEYNTTYMRFARDPGFQNWRQVAFSNKLDIELSPGRVTVRPSNAQTGTRRHR